MLRTRRSCALSSPTTPMPARSFSSQIAETPEIYTLSLHDALPILAAGTAVARTGRRAGTQISSWYSKSVFTAHASRSEEHTSELQSLTKLVCRPLLEKKNHTRSEDGKTVAPVNSASPDDVAM